MRITKELLDKAERIFAAAKNGSILTGQGLSRKELRLLERRGMVESRLLKYKDNGQIIRGWQLVGTGILEKNA